MTVIEQRETRARAAVKRLFYRDPTLVTHTWVIDTGQDFYEYQVMTGRDNDRPWYVVVTVGDNNKVAGVLCAASSDALDEKAWDAIRDPVPVLYGSAKTRQRPQVTLHSFSGRGGDKRTFWFKVPVLSTAVEPEFHVTAWDLKDKDVGGLPGCLASSAEFLWQSYVMGDEGCMTVRAKALGEWLVSRIKVRVKA